MKFENVSDKDKKLIIKRAIGYNLESEDISDILRYAFALEDALIQKSLNNSNQRKELQRLNHQVRYINEVNAVNSLLLGENHALNELLDREENKNVSDTDPDQLKFQYTPVNNGAEDPEAQRLKDWDMKTRYPDLQPRKIYG